MAPNDVTSRFNKTPQGRAASLNSDIDDYAIHFPSSSTNSPSSSVLPPCPPSRPNNVFAYLVHPLESMRLCMGWGCVHKEFKKKKKKEPSIWKSATVKMPVSCQLHSCGYCWHLELWREMACSIIKQSEIELTTSRGGKKMTMEICEKMMSERCHAFNKCADKCVRPHYIRAQRERVFALRLVRWTFCSQQPLSHNSMLEPIKMRYALQPNYSVSY